MNIRTLWVAAAAGFLLVCGPASAEERTITTTTTAGTISEFSPDTIVVRSTTSPEPLRYSYTRETTYVDDTGAPVSLEVVKSGLPVTVHYINEGPRVIARKVIVHRTEPQVIERSTTIRREVDDDDDDDDDDVDYDD